MQTHVKAPDPADLWHRMNAQKKRCVANDCRWQIVAHTMAPANPLNC